MKIQKFIPIIQFMVTLPSFHQQSASLRIAFLLLLLLISSPIMAREASLAPSVLCHNATGGSYLKVLPEENVAAVALCSPPENLTETNQTSSTIILRWQYTAGISYQVRWKESTATTWSQSSTFCCSNSFYLNYRSGLPLGQTYQWQIRSICPDGASDWSAERIFTPICPMVTVQSEVLTLNSAQLTWNYMTTSTGSSLTYNLQWRAVGTTAWTSVTNVCCSQYPLNNLTKGQAYEWQIQTICPDGSTTAYTAPRTFTASCGLPSSYYTDFITSTSAKLYWSTSQSGVTFAIRYRPRTTPEATWTLVSGLTSPPYNLTGLTNGQTYEWQVQTLCSADDSSPFSNTASFTTNCSTPYLYYNTPSADRIALSWYDYGPGARYTIVYRSVSSPTSTTISNLTTTTYSLTGLTAGLGYQAQLQLVCSDGNVSGLSSPVSFTPNCNAPGSYGAYTITIYATSTSVRWETFGTGISYEVQYRPQGTTTWLPSLTATTSPFTIPNLTPQTAYEWQIRTLCTNGSQSAWTSTSSFTTSSCSAPSQLYETYSEGGSTLLFWSSNNNGKFVLQWRPVGLTQWSSVTVTANNYRLDGLSSGSSYEWRVQSLCSDVYSSTFSTTRTFTTYCSYPSTRGESYVTDAAAEVYWFTQMGLRYQVRWRQVGTISWTTSQTVSYAYNGYAFQTLSTSLVAGTAYEWQIQSSCSDGSPSGYSPSRTFTAQCTTSGLLENKYVSQNAIGLIWGGPASGLAYELRWRVQGTTTWTGNATALTNTYAVTGLAANTGYDIQVRTICNTSVWSATRTIYTPSVCGYPNSSLIVLALNPQTITIDWGGFPDAKYANFTLRPIGNTASTNVTGITTSPYTLTGLIPNTAYTLNYETYCSNTVWRSSLYFITPPLSACSAMYTLADGTWDNPATWSCNRVPNSSDAVEIRHAVTIPANATGSAQRINYASGGRIISGTGGKLQLGL